jgi:hypothetical protein
MPQSNSLLTASEAAEFLHLDAQTLRRWRAQGFGPAFIRLRRQIRYSPVDLQGYLNAVREGADYGF